MVLLLMRHRKMTRRHDEARAARRLHERRSENSAEKERARFWANFGPDEEETCESTFYLNGPEDLHECIRPEGHLDDGYVHFGDNCRYTEGAGRRRRPEEVLSWPVITPSRHRSPETPPTR
jgi:hypothetical protein